MDLGFLNFYNSLLDVRDTRATLLANNIANADTPNYKAADIDFTAALSTELANPGAPLIPAYRADATVGLNGNDVALDSERLESAANGEGTAGAVTFLHQATSALITALRPNPSGI